MSGWGTHVCDVDEVAVEQAIDGEPVRLNHCDLRAAAVRMRAQGVSLTVTAERLRRPARTISRALRMARIAA